MFLLSPPPNPGTCNKPSHLTGWRLLPMADVRHPPVLAPKHTCRWSKAAARLVIKRAGCCGTVCIDRCKTDGKLKRVRDTSCAVDGRTVVRTVLCKDAQQMHAAAGSGGDVCKNCRTTADPAKPTIVASSVCRRSEGMALRGASPVIGKVQSTCCFRTEQEVAKILLPQHPPKFPEPEEGNESAEHHDTAAG